MAAFAGLAERLQETFKKLRGKGKLGENDVQEAMREVRLAFLEADVNYKVVKDFISRVKERAVGQEVMRSLTPAQQVIKIVNEEMTSLMGEQHAPLRVASRPPTVLMLVGLQGAGKTTTAGKLAAYLRRQGKRPLLVAADVYRPAAIKQLEVLGKQLDLPVFAAGDTLSPLQIARAGVEHALSRGCDTLILDTAGRLHINEELMEELKGLRSELDPQEVLLVVDAMTGQDAVNVAEAFQKEVGITGVILTKLDGDTRGGAALSVRAVTGCPIKFAGTGEKLDALEPFHPERMASRILGMGDVLSLIEKAQAGIDQEKAREMERKLRQQQFDLEDFLEQLQQMRSLGPLEEVLGMLPGLGKLKQMKNLQVDEKDLRHTEAIIRSMTSEERHNPTIMNASRKRRVASGSGTKIQDVNKLLKQFEEARAIMRRLGGELAARQGKKNSKGGLNLPFIHK